MWKLSDEIHSKECSVSSMWPVWPGWITKHLCEACIDSVSPFQPWLSMNSQCALSWCAQITHDRVTSRAALHKTLYDKKCAVWKTFYETVFVVHKTLYDIMGKGHKTLWYNMSRSQDTLWYNVCSSQNAMIHYEQIIRHTMRQCVHLTKHSMIQWVLLTPNVKFTKHCVKNYMQLTNLWYNVSRSQNILWKQNFGSQNTL